MVKSIEGFPRLMWDEETSAKWPCVRGAWVTIDSIIRLIVKGESWASIINGCPELMEEDIREAIRYYMIN